MKNLLVIAVIVLGFAGQASAAPIVGTLNFGGSVTVTATTIDWEDDGAIPNAVIMDNSTGYFSDLSGGATPSYASSIDLTAPTQAVDDFIYDFNNAATDPPHPEYDDLTFDLTDIIEPTAPPCDPTETYTANESCSLGPFTLTVSSGGGTTITLDVRGNFDDPSAGQTDVPAVGIYTAQRTESIASILAIFGPNGSQSFNTSYSASITAIPEPATLLTFGAGTALLAAHRRRRAKKNNG